MNWKNFKSKVGHLALLIASFIVTSCISSRLTITVPKGYYGQITLVLSNVDKDILTVDSNGIGYITKHTFDKTYMKPIVRETDGTYISSKCVGFNPSAFWAKNKFGFANEEGRPPNKDIEFLSFEIVPKEKHGRKQYYDPDLVNLIDTSKVLYQQELDPTSR